jgi:hypothetical protein
MTEEKKPSPEEIEVARKEFMFLLFGLEKNYDTALRVLMSYPSRIDKFVATVVNDGKTITTQFEFFKGDMKVIPSEFLPTEDPKDLRIKTLEQKVEMLSQALKIAIRNI